MAFHALRLRRVLSLSYPLLNHSLHGPKPIPSLLSRPRPSPTPFSTQMVARPFTSTSTLFRKTFDPETDEIGPDTILFEGCDYNHWLITMDFPKDSNLTRDQMIETYVNTAAQIFGSVEEAKKKIYALSTTTYQGFQVLCSEETSEKFKSLPGVVFVLPDSYIDPVNKEYGGDKYVNGEIFPRPPPVHYGRRSNRDRRPREQNYGTPHQQNRGPAPQQHYGPPPQQHYGPPPQQNHGPPPSQNYAPPPRQNYVSPPQNYGPPPPQNYGPPPPQNYGSPPPQNYGPPPQQNYRPTQQGYAPRPHQSSGPSPQQSYVPRTQQSYGNFNQVENWNHYAQGHENLQSHMPPEQRGILQDANYESSQGGTFEQVSGEQRNITSHGNN